jgi:hypothetical protein
LAVRTGTLWEGRYKASPVDSESHVLHCQRYIDLNPVRARMTDDPADYPRSSCPAHCGRRSDAMLTPHPAYTALASEPASFCAKACPTTIWRPSGPISNSNVPWVETIPRDGRSEDSTLCRHQACAQTATLRFKRL